ncbi:MAG: hypothetical protein H7Y60_14555 [Rhodospirillaceae bacterium]|nr:hypothetical protein [Rhodospirillales bacterium]
MRPYPPAHRIGPSRPCVKRLRRYYADLTRPDLPSHGGNWGLQGVELEEINLAENRAATFANAVSASLPPAKGGYTAIYRPDVYDVPTYAPEHVLPFLADLIYPLPRNTRFSWFGGCRRTLELFVTCLAQLGFVQPILVGSGCGAMAKGLERCHIDDAVLTDATVFFMDFGVDEMTGQADRLTRLTPVKQGFDALMDMEESAIPWPT